MIQFLAPFLAPTLSTALAGRSVPFLAKLGTTLLGNPMLGSAVTSGIGSLLAGDDIGDALKNAAIGGVGGALGLGGTGAGMTADAAKTAALENTMKEKGIGSLLNNLTGKDGIFSPGNLLLMSAFAPRPKNPPKRKPYLGGGYYGPGGRYVPASRVFGAVEGGRIEGPGTPTSDSIPAMIYQDGKPVQEAALSTQEVVLSHKDLAAMDPNGDYERASEIIGNAKNGDRAKAAAEMYLKMQRA
jgi:hypothetical protein